MVDIATHPSGTATRLTAAAIAAMLVLAALVLRVLDPGRVAWVRTFFVIFGSLLIQALPFVMLGALAAALVEVFVPIGTLEKLGRLPRPLQLPAAALSGLAFPICECGSVPVARRLMQRGLMPSAAVTFMLAAPVINPVVIASTFVAFRGRSSMWAVVGGRFLLGIVVAVAVGWVLGKRTTEELLKPNPEETHEPFHEQVHVRRVMRGTEDGFAGAIHAGLGPTPDSLCRGRRQGRQPVDPAKMPVVGHALALRRVRVCPSAAAVGQPTDSRSSR